jgi:hypothetical protein
VKGIVEIGLDYTTQGIQEESLLQDVCGGFGRLVVAYAGNEDRLDRDAKEVANLIKHGLSSVGETLFSSSHNDTVNEESSDDSLQQSAPPLNKQQAALINEASAHPELAAFLRETNPELAVYEAGSGQKKLVNQGREEKSIESVIRGAGPMHPGLEVKADSGKKGWQKPINARVKGSYTPKTILESAEVYHNNENYGLGLTNAGLTKLISIAAINVSLGDVLGSKNQSLKTQIDDTRQKLSNSHRYTSKTFLESIEMRENKQGKIGLEVTHQEFNELIMMAVTCPSLESFLASKDPSLQERINAQKD